MKMFYSSKYADFNVVIDIFSFNLFVLKLHASSIGSSVTQEGGKNSSIICQIISERERKHCKSILIMRMIKNIPVVTTYLSIVTSNIERLHVARSDVP